MTKKDLVRIIREVVRKEVGKVVKAELNEAMNLLEQKKSVPSKMSLSEAVQQTKEQNTSEDEWPSMGTFNSNMRAQFAAMNGSPMQQMTDINNRPVNTEKLDPTLSKALTRDYSELVKRF